MTDVLCSQSLQDLLPVPLNEQRFRDDDVRGKLHTDRVQRLGSQLTPGAPVLKVSDRFAGAENRLKQISGLLSVEQRP